MCDCLHLPYRTGLFDAAICIAVVHHLSTEERRLAALRELSRVLRPGGNLLVYVWAMEQDGRKVMVVLLTVAKQHSALPISLSLLLQFDRQDVLVPWHLQPKYSPGANLNATSQAKAKMDPIVPRKRGNPKRRCGAEEGSETAPTPCCATNEPTQASLPFLLGSSCPDSMVERQVQELSPSIPPLSPSQQQPSLPSHLGQDGNLRELGYQTFLRYYHVFQRGELSDLFARGVDDLVVKEEIFDHDNWCVMAQKVLKI